MQARAKIKGQMERNQELYVDGARDKPKYLAEKARLERLDLEYAAQAAPLPDKAELVTIGAQWKQGTVGQKWGVLNALFERIVVHDGKVVGFKPRADRTAKVRVLIQTARDYAFGFDAEMDERDGDGPGAANISGSGKGGIPTVDWKYRARIA